LFQIKGGNKKEMSGETRKERARKREMAREMKMEMNGDGDS
jgi:hypothetical protein